MDDNTIVPQTDPVTTTEPEITNGGFDPQSFGDNIISKIEAKFPDLVEQVSAKTRDEIIAKIVGQEEKKAEKYVPESYEELMDKTVSKAVEAFEKKQQEARAKIDEESAANQTKQQQIVEANNEYWDKQLSDLETAGNLQSMPESIVKKLAEGKELTESERQHPSVSARAEIYSKSRELKDAGDADWWNLKYVAYRYGIGRNRGADAPVYGNPSYSPEESHDTYSYEDIHNMSYQDIAKGR